jgi:hypothetical protein
VFFIWVIQYDVSNDGVKVAILTFPKTAYRFGETVSGVVVVRPLLFFFMAIDGFIGLSDARVA